MERPSEEAPPRRRAGDRPPREMVSFRLGEQDFCIDIMNVREIRRWSPPTALPHAPAHVLGLVNLRGAVLPVLDLARRLGLAADGAPPGASGRAVVIVAVLGERVFGLVVDTVSDILSVPEEAVRPVPAIGAASEPGLIQGIAAVGGRMIRLLDLAGVLGVEPGGPA